MASLQERVDAYLEAVATHEEKGRQLLQEMLDVMNGLTEDVTQAQTTSDHYYNLMNQEAQSRRQLEKLMDAGRFVLVLLDLDSMPFLDTFVLKGMQGGIEAGRELRNAVQHFHQSDPFHRGNDQIVLYISANLHGMTRAYISSGIIRDHKHYHNFIVGLSQSHPLTTFVDAGRQKEAVDYKLRAQFELYYANKHCQHIIFAGSDNGYAAFLDAFANPRDVNKRVTVLLTPHTPSGLRNASSQFLTTTFDVFRENKLDTRGMSRHSVSEAVSHNVKSDGISLGYDENTSPAAIIAADTGHKGAPTEEIRGIKRAPSDDKDPPFRRPAPPQYRHTTYDSKAPSYSDNEESNDEYRPEHPTLVDDARPPKKVFVNQYGRRLDVPVRFDKQFLQVLFGPKSKLCNNYYLRENCPYGDRCSWDHSLQLSALQVNTLRHKARTSACSDPFCKDPNCVLGHVCPRPVGRCNVSGCKFLPEQHIDVSNDEVYELDPSTGDLKKTSRVIFRKSSTAAPQKPALASSFDMYTTSDNDPLEERHYSIDEATVVSEADQFLSELGLWSGAGSDVRRGSVKRTLASDYF